MSTEYEDLEHGVHRERYYEDILPVLEDFEESVFMSKEVAGELGNYSPHQIGRTLSYLLDHEEDLERIQVSPSIWVYGEKDEETVREYLSELDETDPRNDFIDTVFEQHLSEQGSLSQDKLRGIVYEYLENEEGVNNIGKKARLFGEISTRFRDISEVKYVVEENLYVLEEKKESN